jgi:hypothetical protein
VRDQIVEVSINPVEVCSGVKDQVSGDYKTEGETGVKSGVKIAGGFLGGLEGEMRGFFAPRTKERPRREVNESMDRGESDMEIWRSDFV